MSKKQLKLAISLLFFNRIFCTIPLAPTAFKGIHICVTFGHQFPCQTGTGAFIRSGAVQNQCLVFRVIPGPGFKLTRVGPDSSLDFEFGCDSNHRRGEHEHENGTMRHGLPTA